MLLFTTFAGACIAAGGLLARVERIHPKWLEKELRHSVIAFGGGVLISAVALVLVPEGSRFMTSATSASLFLVSGGITFFVVERFLGLRRRESPQLTAMLLDYLPEGFNAYRELGSLPHNNRRKTLMLMCMLIPLGPLVGTLGWLYGAEHTVFLGGVMLFASGGILYLIFQDIAPQSRLDRHWAPALGAVLGFGIGMLGQLLIPSS